MSTPSLGHNQRYHASLCVGPCEIEFAVISNVHCVCGNASLALRHPIPLWPGVRLVDLTLLYVCN